MARYKGPVLKRARALGLAPQVLGINKKSNKNPGKGKNKLSEYGLQLKEKQKAKFVYGILEKQFRKVYKTAEKMSGITGENLLQLLELRFDNVVYRMGFAKTRNEAKQLISHGHFLVNGSKVDIPSYRLAQGDVITVREKSRRNGIFKYTEDKVWNQAKWVSVDTEKLEGKVESNPNREDIDFEINEQLIVELYSR
ncbi:30S ribosomal protein S4 [Helcococcus ovis]|uniref:Small ribosomal subunit protein uS4 n=1 Tax=Helcococcus ovis TaxID=72026 RepID=A0A4R9C4F1_9FIRM|nr:30S ribosomal protein S4 [Helcococcus ovis]TFF66240.1 30S ribosomal protein S4 [Helcococcus ovis]TFF67281.1 30S ribosomal protein S4 [Helcococcus ovis]TFF68317.1 30S ribosomal protein S4 [Helcococcus ovis]WNZ00932.1 30S ribosomal protein S4 [Helcococcus ovis]